MGSGSSQHSSARRDSAAIDKALKAMEVSFRKTLSILMLGPSEVGKTTIVKQVKLLHTNTYANRSDRNKFTGDVYAELVRSLIVLGDAFVADKVAFARRSAYADLDYIKDHFASPERWTADGSFRVSVELFSTIKRLIIEEEVFTAYLRSSACATHPDANMYFIYNFERMMTLNYEVTTDDIMHLRQPTSVIQETMFHSDGFQFRVIDVGGQKGLRKKWIKVFSGVNATMFLCALSDYNLAMREDPSTNRIVDALKIFADLMASNILEKACVVLLLNKRDLLEQKLKTFLVKTHFPRFEGPNTPNEVTEFFKKKFLKFQTPSREIFAHVTCATDTNQMQNVIANVVAMVIEQNIRKAGVS